MFFDPMYYPFASKRMLTYGRKGMVATSQHLAAQAGLDIIKKGGNAIDAAVATAACLVVVEPISNGVGGDAFAIIWKDGKIHGLNASGPAPKRITADAVRALGHKKMPEYGWIPVTVPGAPGGWAGLVEKFGNLTLKEVLEPAIRYARYGYPVSPSISREWANYYKEYIEKFKGEEFKHWFETFAPGGRAPYSGEIWKCEELADTLERIAESNAKEFYRGKLAEKIDAFSQTTGGYLRGDDLAAYDPEWVEPVSVNYRGYDVWEIPPNGQGIVALMALNILNGFDFDTCDRGEIMHRQIEAIKLAYVDGMEYIADPASMDVPVTSLLSEAYAKERRKLITDKAIMPEIGKPPRGGTIYLAAADGEGNMVSYIQSNYMGFGSGLVVPGTGIAIHNRGNCFTLDESKPNCLRPGRKPYHTIIPGFLTKGSEAVGPFGVMGGFMQPQGHVQVVMNMIDFNLNPQAALDSPRWRWIEGKKVDFEVQTGQPIVDVLQAKGHETGYMPASGYFGRGQIICKDENGVLAGGTEPRADGAVVAW